MTTLRLKKQLNDLKTTFDQAILNGTTFTEVKKIYLEMKALKNKMSDDPTKSLRIDPLEDYICEKEISDIDEPKQSIH